MPRKGSPAYVLGAMSMLVFALAGLKPARHMIPVQARDAKSDTNLAAFSSARESQGWQMLSEFISTAEDPSLGSAPGSPWASGCMLMPETCPAGIHLNSRASIFLAHRPIGLDSNNFGLSSSDGESIFYNPVAQDTIRKCRNKDQGGCPAGASFPVGSMIGRFAWAKARKCRKLYVFNPVKDLVSYSTTDTVALDTGSCSSSPDSVSIKHFFYVPITKRNHGSFMTGNGEVLEIGDYAVILGFHLIKKTSDGWFWATFWWSSKPEYGGENSLAGHSCLLSHSCPQNGRGPDEWGNYVINTIGTDQRFIAISNPYVDPQNPPRQNCLVCHSFAMVPSDLDAGQNNAPTCGAEAGSSLSQASMDAHLKAYRASCNPPRLSSDNVWTLAEHPNAAFNNSCKANVCSVTR